MTVFAGAVDATFAAFGIDAVYTPAGGESVSVRVIARRPDTIVGFEETRIDALDPKAARQRVVDRPVVGTQLIREWRGVEQRVTVLADGFEWESRRYRSLSAVARAITGTQWNGWTFFGMKRNGGGR
jgi:hypothetical protein